MKNVTLFVALFFLFSWHILSASQVSSSKNGGCFFSRAEDAVCSSDYKAGTTLKYQKSSSIDKDYKPSLPKNSSKYMKRRSLAKYQSDVERLQALIAANEASGGFSGIQGSGNPALPSQNIGPGSRKLMIKKSGTYDFKGQVYDCINVPASNVVILNAHINGRGGTCTSNIDGNNIIVKNSLFENVSTNPMVRITGNNVELRDNVIRYTVPAPKKDRHCVLVPSGANGFRMINNKVYDCAGDGLQFGPGAQSSNVLIEGNEFYVERYRLGEKNCAENAMDFKGGNGVLVRNNVMHGFRPTDSEVCGTGSQGHAVINHMNAANITYDSNKTFDVPDCSRNNIRQKKVGGIHRHRNINILENNTCR